MRVPSGVSYMLENRMLMKRLFPELFEVCDILPVDDYTTRLQAPCIVSANVGCIQHLQSGTELPVRHWIEVLDHALFQ